MKTKIKVHLDKNAIAQLEHLLKRHYPEKGDDAGMKKMYTEDRRALRTVLLRYKTGKWVKAGELANQQDAAVKDMIPDAIWNAIITAYRYE